MQMIIAHYYGVISAPTEKRWNWLLKHLSNILIDHDTLFSYCPEIYFFRQINLTIY